MHQFVLAPPAVEASCHRAVGAILGTANDMTSVDYGIRPVETPPLGVRLPKDCATTFLNQAKRGPL